MSQEQDKSFFRNFSLIVGALAVLMVIFIITARIVGTDEEAANKREAASAAKLTAPVGEVSAAKPQEAAQAQPEQAPAEAATTGAAPAVAAAVQDGMAATAASVSTDAAAAPAGPDGKKVFDGLCISCHGSKLPGIPQFGDKAAWAPRIAQGKETLYQHALHGFTGKSGMMMPPKGGGTNTDDEVKAAVDYMVSNSQ